MEDKILPRRKNFIFRQPARARVSMREKEEEAEKEEEEEKDEGIHSPTEGIPHAREFCRAIEFPPRKRSGGDKR